MSFSLGFKKLFELNVPKTLAKSFSSTQVFFTNKTTKIFRKDIVIRNIDETQRSPLMVLIGWSNSKNKQLAKYSELYEKQGLTTVSISCPLYRFAFFYDSLFAGDTKACIDALSSQRDINKDRKVIFQCFSTPGPAMYINIINYYYQYIQGHFGTDVYQNKNVEDVPNISGLILDSPTVACGDAQQFANGMKGNTKNMMSDLVFDLLGKIMFAYAVRTSKMYNYGPEFFRNIPVLIPQLMLFSKNDKIAGYEAILDYVKHQRSIGASVQSHMWEDSAHVLHYRNNPDEYRELVTSFIGDCVASTDLSALPLSESKIFSVLESEETERAMNFSQKEKL